MRHKTILIFEGLKATGKTLLSSAVAKALERQGAVRLFSEEETLQPVRKENDAELLRRHYLGIIEEIENSPLDTFILDRFHLTKAAPTFPDFYTPVVQKLLCFNTRVFLLAVRCETLEERFRQTQTQRGPAWRLNAEGLSPEVDARQSCDMQKTLEEHLEASPINFQKIDTTEKDWGKYTARILSIL